MARRAFVRRVLGSMVDRPAESLAFRPGRCGKPYLSNGTEPGGEVLRTLNFSVSRSEDVLGVTVAFGREVGMDLEVVRSIPDLLAIAATQFGPAGLDLLESSPARERDFQFYRLWTRKEACAKLQGRGIACRHAHEPPTIAPWTLRSLTFREGGMGYGDAKKALLARVDATFAPIRERAKALRADPARVEGILARGAERARANASSAH